MNSGNRPAVSVFFWVLFCGAGWLVVALCLWGCVCDPGAPESDGRSKVHFLDVGQGLAVLLEQDGRFALYDAGPDSAGVWDSLRMRGVDTLEWAVVSHNHRDHGGGLLELMEAREGNAANQRTLDRSASRPGNLSRVFIRRLHVGPDTAGGFVRDSVLRVASRLNIPVDTLYRGDELSLGTLTLKVLWPTSFLRVGDNGASLVMRGAAGGASSQWGVAGGTSSQWGASGGPSSQLVSAGGFPRAGSAGDCGTSFLLTGDLDSAGERRLMELSPDLCSGLLQVGHHGSSGSSSLRFLSRVSPQFAAISVGAHNGYGHPTGDVLKKLEYVLGAVADSSRSSPIARTDQDGTITFQIIPGVGPLRD